MSASSERSMKSLRFVRYGDLVLLNESTLVKLGLDISTLVQEDDEVLLQRLKRQFRCKRLAVKASINNDDYRSPNVRILTGGDKGEKEGEAAVDPWVMQVDNGIKYCFNIERSMFCKGNITEKLRLSKLDCSGETVVDLFAGIGYFALVFAVHCYAQRVYCCEWNPAAVEALRRNALLNKVDDRIIICEGDNRLVCPVGVASRVNMGLIPSSLASLETACKALDVTTFPRLYLHVHENLSYPVQSDLTTESKKELVHRARRKWADGIAEQVRQTMARLHPGLHLDVAAEELFCIKAYAPHIDHMVVDICCRPRRADSSLSINK